MGGHTVLQLPVPELEDWVVARTRHYNATFVSEDPRFGHAHITALGPFDPAPTSEVLAQIGAIAAATEPIEVTLERVDQFPTGIIHLVPEPVEPFVALTARLVARFAQFPPYAGEFGPAVAPHLTLDAASDEVDVDSTRALLGAAVPVTCRLETLQLAWWQSGACRVLHEWPLG